MLEITSASIQRHQSLATPILRFEDIPLDLSDLRLMVRQIADVLRRYGALEEHDYQKVQALGRDMQLLDSGSETASHSRSRQWAFRPLPRLPSWMAATCSIRC
jgi:hypothetical protein